MAAQMSGSEHSYWCQVDSSGARVLMEDKVSQSRMSLRKSLQNQEFRKTTPIPSYLINSQRLLQQLVITYLFHEYVTKDSLGDVVVGRGVEGGVEP